MKQAGTVVVVSGPPWSGKSTQARNIARLCKCPILDFGDELRGKIKKDSEFNSAIGRGMDSGEYVTNDIIFDFFDEISEQLLNNPHNGYPVRMVLVGFPRTFSQVNYLAEKLGDSYTFVHICLILKKEKIIIRRQRTQNYASDRLGRKDDERHNFEIRWKGYTKETEPVLKHLDNLSQASLSLNTASMSRSQVFREIKQFIKGIFSPSFQKSFTTAKV